VTEYGKSNTENWNLVYILKATWNWISEN